MKTPDDILVECSVKRRVCPQPQQWNKLWELLPDRRRQGEGWEPPLPLILAAWHHTSDAEKRERLRVHLRWAAAHGALDKVANFISSLKPEDWHTER
jgi:hypothetical protein